MTNNNNYSIRKVKLVDASAHNGVSIPFVNEGEYYDLVDLSIN